MSLENNRKILIGTAIQSLDNRLVLGDSDNESFVLLTLLKSYVDYSTLQQNLGNESYYEKIKNLESKIQDLKYKCSDICIYKKRIITNRNPITNQPPIVTTQDQNLELANFGDVVNTVIDSTITYTGTGRYIQSWELISGLEDSVIIDNTLEDITVQNLQEGIYVFRITVITTEDGFVVTEDAIITITSPSNTPPNVDDETLNLNFSTDFQANQQETFNTSLFLNNFTDLENDDANNIRITSLPTLGTLLFNNTPVTVGFIFPVADAANLTYSIDNVKQEVDGLYVYPNDIESQISQLLLDGYVFNNYQNGVYTYSLLSDDLIDSGVDGTFDSLPGINSTFNGNVTGGGWQNGNGSADSVLPDPNSEPNIVVGPGCPPSPQGGIYAGAISIGDATPVPSGEAFFTEINVVAGRKYIVSFYQTFAGDAVLVQGNQITYPIGTEIPWRVSLGSVLLFSDPNPWLGIGNQVWEAQSLEFTAAETGLVQLLFQAGNNVDGTTPPNRRNGYLGCDDVKIQEVLTTVEGTEIITGQLINDSISFQVSDDNSQELYSTETNIIIQE